MNNSIIIGFIGTYCSMSENQIYNVYEYLKGINNFEAIHRGYFISDEQFHVIAKCFTSEIYIYPGHSVRNKHDMSLRAFCKEGHIFPSQPHLKRNRTIVENCDILLACPYSNIEKGGTWYTINYAKKINKNCIIFSV